jgi:hypothetical protein
VLKSIARFTAELIIHDAGIITKDTVDVVYEHILKEPGYDANHEILALQPNFAVVCLDYVGVYPPRLGSFEADATIALYKEHHQFPDHCQGRERPVEDCASGY